MRSMTSTKAARAVSSFRCSQAICRTSPICEPCASVRCSRPTISAASRSTAYCADCAVGIEISPAAPGNARCCRDTPAVASTVARNRSLRDKVHRYRPSKPRPMSHNPGLTSAPSSPKAATPNQLGGIGMPSGLALNAAGEIRRACRSWRARSRAPVRNAGGTKLRSVASRIAMRIWKSSTSAGTGF